MDLNFERDEKKRIYELEDMPIYIAEKIMEHLDIVDRLSTRKVCRGLRAIVNGQKATIDEVSMKINENSCEIHFGHHQKIEFISTEKKGKYLLKTPQKTVSLEGDHVWKGSEEFASVLNNPKWKFKNLNLEFNWEDDPWPVFILDAYLSFHQIHVENLRIKASTVAPMAHILHCFQADPLNSLNFEYKDPLPDFLNSFIPNILKMDQWKKAKQLKMDGRILDDFPFEELLHAENITVLRIGLTEKRLEEIRDILFKSPIFESCSLGHSYFDSDVEDLVRAVDRVMGIHSAYDHRQKRYRIEDSEDYFQISYRRDDTRAPEDLFLEIQKFCA